MKANAAIKRERQLKKWSRAKKLALITGNRDKLNVLSCPRDDTNIV
jgi:predicted GIY-YIG superfamily endonuclease